MKLAMVSFHLPSPKGLLPASSSRMGEDEVSPSEAAVADAEDGNSLSEDEWLMPRREEEVWLADAGEDCCCWCCWGLTPPFNSEFKSEKDSEVRTMDREDMLSRLKELLITWKAEEKKNRLDLKLFYISLLS